MGTFFRLYNLFARRRRRSQPLTLYFRMQTNARHKLELERRRFRSGEK